MLGEDIGGGDPAQRYGVPLLGSLPLDVAIREQADAGTPIVAAQPDSAASQAYLQVAAQMMEKLAARPRAAISLQTSLG